MKTQNVPMQWVMFDGKNTPRKGEQVLIYACSIHYVLAKWDSMMDESGVYRDTWVTYDSYHFMEEIKYEVVAWAYLPDVI